MRTILCGLIVLISLSSCALHAEREAKERAYWSWYQTLSSAEQDREDRREAVRLQALGLALSGGGPFGAIQMPRLSAPVPRQSVQCFSTVNQGTVSTFCP